MKIKILIATLLLSFVSYSSFALEERYSFPDIKLINPSIPVLHIKMIEYLDSPVANFQERINKIKNAKDGQLIILTLSKGGDSGVFDPLNNAINTTKGVILTRTSVEGKALSFGAIGTMAGHLVELHNDEKLYFHGVTAYPQWYQKVGEVLVRITYKYHHQYSTIFDTWEWQQLYNPDNMFVELTGKRICDRLKDRIIKKLKDGCIFRGFRYD